MKIDRCVILALAIFALIVVGELCTVNNGVHNYDSSAEWKDGYVEYSVTSSGTETYDVILMDNKGYISTDQLMIYVDDDYEKNFQKANEALPMESQDQKEAYREISAALRHRGFTDCRECDDDGLVSFLKETMDQKGKGLLISSYEVPSSVYDGTDDCLLVKWVRNGGNLYWYGTEIGAFAKTSDGVVRMENNQMLFFGADGCINREHNTGVKDTNDVTKMLSLRNSMLRYGLDVSKTKAEFGFATGFTDGGYSTVGMVTLGSGSVCVFSETFSVYAYDDIAQIVASRINPHTVILDHDSGNVKGTISGKMDVNVSDHHLYIYIGGHYTVYGRSY